MPQSKKTTIKSATTRTAAKQIHKSPIKSKQIRIPKTKVLERSSGIESYASLLLGVIVVSVVAIIIFFFMQYQRGKHIQENSAANTPIDLQSLSVTVSPDTTEMHTDTSENQATASSFIHEEKAYTVQTGDNLWNIAEKITGSGYNWVKIAKANNILTDPGLLFAGQKLIIPPILEPTPSMQPVITKEPMPTPTIQMLTKEIAGTEYIIQAEDTLWSIAIRAYNDGYKWIEIARVNGLSHPSLIHAGNMLKIPRSAIK